MDPKIISIFLAERRGTGPDVFFVDSANKKIQQNQALFKPQYQFAYDVQFVSDIEKADMVMIPQPIYEDSPETREYVKGITRLAVRTSSHSSSSTSPHTIPTLLFIGGDLSHTLNFPGTFVLKATQYKSLLKLNDVIIPAFCEDFGLLYGMNIRKKSAKPVVSFCGWAGFPTFRNRAKYLIRNFIIELKKLIKFDPSLEVFKKGIYFRRKALRLLSNSGLVQAKFITRNSFSGHSKTISLSPEQAREEYVANMLDSDFVLAPKGDGNYSVRFFEALSCGRIPILIDTDVCLPLEDVIDYSKFIIRVNHRDIKKLPEIVSRVYESLSDEKFADMQKAARQAFETYLRYDSFFNTILPQICLKNK